MNLPEAKKINAQQYEAGLSLFKKVVIKIKLSANESALGPSPRAIREYKNTSRSIQRYPAQESFLLERLLAQKFKLYAQNWERARYTCYNYKNIRDKAPFCFSVFFKIKKVNLYGF